MRAAALSSLFIVAIIGCSAAGGHSGFTQSSSGAGASGQGGGAGGGMNLGGGFTTSVGVSTGSGSPGCSHAATLVYVLSTDNNIWSFDPPTKKFTQLFALTCATPNDGNTWAPNSMAVDRNVVAWVNYVGSDTLLGTDNAGLVFKVDIDKHTCSPAPAVSLPSASWYRLGMGFSTDAVGGTAETLYVAGTGTPGMANSPGLGKIDTVKKNVVPIGQFSGDTTLSGQSAELTGTGDAKLFGFFTTNPVRVAQMDKSSGKILTDMPVNGVQTPQAWAFSFWGGAFYLYTSPNNITLSTVTRFDPTTQTVDASYNLTAPMTIVGAGVSTCAPIKPTT